MRFLAPLLLMLALLLPSAAFAAESTFFGPIVPPECNCAPEGGISGNGVTVKTSAADWGCILQTVQNGMNFAVSISIIIVLLAIVYAGIVFMTSVGNPESRSGGRKLVINAFLGFLVVMCAWLLVDFIMKIVYHPEVKTGNMELGPWNAILSGEGAPLCIKPAARPKALPDVLGSVGSNVGTGSAGGTGSTGGSSGGGTCTVPTNPTHPCSLEALKGTCFEARGTDAAKVCNYESSGGQTDVRSGSDLLNKGKGPSYSWGLWQINLTTSDNVGGLDCTKAFTNRCEGANIKNQGKIGWCNSSIQDMDLYNRCVAKAKDPRANTLTACQLFREHGNSLNPWKHTAEKICKVPLK